MMSELLIFRLPDKNANWGQPPPWDIKLSICKLVGHWTADELEINCCLQRSTYDWIYESILSTRIMDWSWRMSWRYTQVLRNSTMFKDKWNEGSIPELACMRNVDCGVVLGEWRRPRGESEFLPRAGSWLIITQPKRIIISGLDSDKQCLIKLVFADKKLRQNETLTFNCCPERRF